MNETFNDSIKNSDIANHATDEEGQCFQRYNENDLAVLKNGEASEHTTKDNLVVFKDGDACKDVVWNDLESCL